MTVGDTTKKSRNFVAVTGFKDTVQQNTIFKTEGEGTDEESKQDLTEIDVQQQNLVISPRPEDIVSKK